MIKKVCLLIFTALLIFACGGSDDSEGENTGEDIPVNEGIPSTEGSDGFDRQEMLIHLADNIIVPAYQDLDLKIEALTEATDAFTTEVTEDNLIVLRNAWLEAYTVWQNVEMFNIGKAEELAFGNYMNVYPVNAEEIEANVLSGIYNFDSPANFDTQSFPALDYLLYGVKSLDVNGLVDGGLKAETNDVVLNKFITDINASNYKTYLTDVVSRISSLTGQVTADWEGDFRNEFVNSFANTASSSLNKLVNDFVAYYEGGLRAKKIGFPSGALGFQSEEKIEAFYNQNVSRDFALEGLIAVENLFNGKHYNSDTEELGFKAYLEFLDRSDIVIGIAGQIVIARTTIEALDVNFATQVTTDNIKMLEAYEELQKLVAYFKTDMLKAFDISVDFQDSDGD